MENQLVLLLLQHLVDTVCGGKSWRTMVFPGSSPLSSLATSGSLQGAVPTPQPEVTSPSPQE